MLFVDAISPEGRGSALPQIVGGVVGGVAAAVAVAVAIVLVIRRTHCLNQGWIPFICQT